MSSCTALRARTFLTAATVLAVLGTASLARAEADIGGTIQVKILLPNDNDQYVEVSNQEIIEFFNLAHCSCPDAKFAAKIQLVNLTGGTISNSNVEIWLGNNCDTYLADDREKYCKKLDDGFSDVHDLMSPQTVEISVHDLMFPTAEDGSCERKNDFANNVYVWVDDSDPNDTTFDAVTLVEITLDTKPPPLPNSPVVSAGERAITIDWEVPTSNQNEVFQYQALCARVGDQDPVDQFPRDDPEYQTAAMLCDGDDGVVLHDPDSPDYDAGPSSPDAGPPADADTTDADTADADTADADTTDADTTDAFADDAFADDAFNDPPPQDAGVDVLDDLRHLDTAFICGTKGGTETSMRISGLENGVAYHVALVSIDESRNVDGYYLGTVTPEAVTDFWEEYHNRGGGAEGGICLVTATYGNDHPFTTALRDFRDQTLAHFALGRVLIDLYYATIDPLARLVRDYWPLRVLSAIVLSPLVAAAALWEYTGPLGKLLLVMLWFCWRRRRGRAPRAAMATAVAAGLLFAMAIPAHAQPAPYSPYTPYWDQYDDDTDSQLGPEHLHWNFEFKLGPYLPVIDSEFDLTDGEAGPFEAMYGKGNSLMGILELQRFFLWPAGQFGVAASVGLMGKTAQAFKDEVDATTGLPVRSEGDTTSFRLIPMALSAVYRYTYLDDRWGVPLVPYAKLGLSYYLWWITDPNGSFARVPTSDECTDIYESNCASDRALGASLGWQVALGLAIRAERIDKQAALNLRNEMGIEHAGFFAELLYAKVDHFGSSSRLRVGDMTWFGGITFEF